MAYFSVDKEQGEYIVCVCVCAKRFRETKCFRIGGFKMTGDFEPVVNFDSNQTSQS